MGHIPIMDPVGDDSLVSPAMAAHEDAQQEGHMWMLSMEEMCRRGNNKCYHYMFPCSILMIILFML
jgi:hypothetical protein